MNKINIRLKGQITVFASLIIVLVISVIIASIKSVSLSVAKTNINIACNLSVESMFAEYSKPLLEEFDILLLKNSSQLEQELKKYIEENIKFHTGFASEKLQSVTIAEKVKATDSGGNVIKEEILDYMKYGILSEAAQLIIGSEQQVKKDEKTKELIEKVDACQEYRKEVDNIIFQVLTLVEGLDTDQNGIIVKNDKPSLVDGHFIKEICMENINPVSTVVDNGMVYEVLAPRYINIVDMFVTMHTVGDSISKNNLSESELYNHLNLFSVNYQDFKGLIQENIQKIEEAIKVMEGYDNAIGKITSQVAEVEQDVNANKELIGDDIAKGFEQELYNLKNYGGESSDAICNINVIRNALSNNLTVLKQTLQKLNSINSKINYETANQVMKTVESCIELMSRYDKTQLVFNYSGLEFSNHKSGLGVIENIIKTIKDGMLGLVIEDTSKISNKSIHFEDLASNHKNGKTHYLDNMTENAKDNVIYNEYIVTKFYSFMDGFDSNHNSNQIKDPLDYSIEYILCGKNSDRENLEATIFKLSFIRQGANLSYLFTNYEKKNECYALALSLLGFTGMPAIIKAGQYLIMTAWAYGEAVMDIKSLFEGEKVELTKNNNNWKLSLNNLLNSNFKLDSAKSENTQGLDYEGYLRLLLYMEDPIDKYYRTMDSMELRMIGKGLENFRMYNYIYSMDASANFSINGGLLFYKQDIKFQY